MAKILSHKKGDLIAFVAKKNKRAEKLGVPGISYTFGDAYYAEIDDKTYEFIPVTIDESTIKLNGWAVVGTIDFIDTTPIINSYIDLPAWVFEVAPTTCHHCNVAQRRNKLYVVKNDSGEIKVVGRTCLADFIGHTSAESYAYMAECIIAIIDEMDDMSDVGECTPNCYKTDYVLAVAVKITKEIGYISKDKAADQGTASTADLVRSALCAKSGAFESNEEYLECVEKANKILSWVRDITPDNTYMYNINAIAKLGYITWKQIGFVSSMVPTYHNAMEKAKVSTVESNFIGNVGDKKVEFSGKVVSIFAFSSTFGTIYMHKIDCYGNIVIYKTSKIFADEDQEIKFVGTIKSHEVYNGIKQTVVTRCKLI